MNTGEGIVVRKSADRGASNFGWLKSKKSFSFADYHDDRFMGFRTLRVINEDFIAAGKGFPMHPHRDMEIFSYVLAGKLEHKDSMGNGHILEPGHIQLMTTGTGVKHSEYNPGDEETHILQIWIHPREKGLTPSYTEWQPHTEPETNPKALIISPDGSEDSTVIQQDANIYRVALTAEAQVAHELGEGRGLWLQVLRGSIQLNGVQLNTGDAGYTEKSGIYEIMASQSAEALLFDLL